MLDRIWTALTDRDWKTWLGHFVAGFLIGVLYLLMLTAPLTPEQAVVLAVFTAFMYREVSNFLEHKLRQERFRAGFSDIEAAIEYGKRYEWSADGPKVIDGFIDLWAPVLGAILAALLI